MAQPMSLAPRAFRWSSPYLTHGYIMERQSGYHPEMGSCGTGTTCNSACGNGFVTCNADTNLVLFCYNPSHGQTCCNNGDGQACDAGYYCARDLSNTTWCCENQYNAAQCASKYHLSTLVTGTPSTSTASSTTPGAINSLESSPTSSESTSMATTPAGTTQYNSPTTTGTMGYNNSNITSTSIPAPFIGAAPPYIVSLKKVLLLGILVSALLDL